MKNKKWLTYTLGTLLALAVLAAVGGAGYRIGMMQNKSFARDFNGAPSAMQRNFKENSGDQRMPGNFHSNGGPQFMQENPHNRGFYNRGDTRGGRFFFPFFGLVHLAVMGLIIWVVYKLVKKSGWRLSLTKTSPVPTPTQSITPPDMKGEEQKASE